MLSEYSMDVRYSVRTRSGSRHTPPRVAALRRRCGEDRAVADLVPADQSGTGAHGAWLEIRGSPPSAAGGPASRARCARRPTACTGRASVAQLKFGPW